MKGYGLKTVVIGAAFCLCTVLPVLASTEAVGMPLTQTNEVVQHTTVVTSDKGQFTFEFPWDVSSAQMIDTVTLSKQGTVEGSTVGFALQLQDGAKMTVTRRSNQPQEGVSLEEWNSTWYDTPIQGLSDAEYVNVWKRFDPKVAAYPYVTGGYLPDERMTAARWSYVVKDETYPLPVRFELDLIPKTDPQHRYVMTLEYAKKEAYQLDMLKGLEKRLQPLSTVLTPESKKGIDGTGVAEKNAKVVLDRTHSAGKYKFSSVPVVAKELPIQDSKQLATLYRKEVFRGKQTKQHKENMYIYDTFVKIDATDTVDPMNGTSEPTVGSAGREEAVGDTVLTSVRIDAKGQVELQKHI